MTRRPRLCLIHAFARCSRKAVFLFLILGKGFSGKLHFFGWSRGPAGDLLLCACSVGFAAPRACGAWQTPVGIHARPMSTRCQYIESYIFSLPGKLLKVVQCFAMVKIPVRCAQRTSTVIFSFSLFLFSFPLHSAAPIDILTP